jgi:hypothetical protein
MKKIVLVLFIGLAACSCNVLPLYEEVKNVYFDLENVGKSEYTRVIVYAKDSAGHYSDSTTSWTSFPGSRGVYLGITLSNLKDIKNGIFEIQVDMANGQSRHQTFGWINGLETRQKFKIELKGSTIYVK